MGRRGAETDLDSFSGLGERLAVGGGVRVSDTPPRFPPILAFHCVDLDKLPFLFDP